MTAAERWVLRKTEPRAVEALAAGLGVSPVLARVLAARGFNATGEARDFLQPLEGPVHDPGLLSGMSEAVDRLLIAAESKEKILLHGDYDVDGVTATVLLLPALTRLGLTVHHYLPHRIDDGYGVSLTAVEAAAKAGVSLLITADCGIAAHRELERARELGLDVIITDHHAPPDTLPEAAAVIDPKAPGCRYPNPNLVGVGVTWKLASALGERLGDPTMAADGDDLVALGTIADAASLTGENRTMAARGLEALRSAERPGLLSLCEVAKVAPEEIDSEAVAFALAPRLNAFGRMGDPDDALRLLATTSWDVAHRLAAAAEEANRQRKRIQAATLRDIEKTLAVNPHLAERGAVVLWGEGWHRGVIGIVAAKIWDRFQRPAFIISLDPDGMAYGSARSDGTVPVTEALHVADDLLTGHGGHREAGGFRLPAERLEEFRQRIWDYADSHPTPAKKEIEIPADCEMSLEEVSETILEEISLLEPFGHGNPRPVFLAREVRTNSEIRVVGKDHLRLSCYQGKTCLPGVAFRKAHLLKEMDLGCIDILCEPRWNTFRDRRTLELRIESIRPSKARGRPPRIESGGNCRHRTNSPDWLVDLRASGGGVMSDAGPGDTVLALINADTPRGALEEWLRETWRRSNPVWVNSQKVLENLPRGEHSTFVVRYTDLSRFWNPDTPPDHLVLWDFPASERSLAALALFRRDGPRRSQVYLSFDAARLEWQRHVLERLYPDRDLLRRIYSAIRGIEHPPPVPVDHVSACVSAARLPGEALTHALTVFHELDLVTFDADEETVAITPDPRKCSLEDSATHRAAMRTREERESLARFLLDADPVEILERIARAP
jgi:single-stranded-DNA-specific exonuclease